MLENTNFVQDTLARMEFDGITRPVYSSVLPMFSMSLQEKVRITDSGQISVDNVFYLNSSVHLKQGYRCYSQQRWLT